MVETYFDNLQALRTRYSTEQATFLLTNNSFIHSFILHSVNPYKVRQPKGYRIYSLIPIL
jgi:hypothetical protein